MDGVARVLIVDDHELVRQALTQLISDEPDLEVCGTAANVPAGLREVSEHDPDMIVLDLSLQGGDGIDLIKAVRGQQRHLPILVVTMHSESFYAERAFRAGASGYLTKEEASEKILVAIRTVLRGELYVSERLSPFLLQRLITGNPGTGESLVTKLSDRELQVFLRIGEGRSTQETASNLNLSVKTIETYRGNIKEKLGLRDARELIQYAIRWTMTQTK
jgi:DNA-binding NarL/FixJ family response regulator